jgi:asparagine synthase (glutamine-hydrolysing)
VPDNLGRLRLYAAESPEGVFVGTSPVALARATGRAEPDPVAVWELLLTGVLYEDRSPFAGVRRLMGGKRYRFRAGRAAGADDALLLPPRAPGPATTAAEVGAACRAAVAEWLPRGARPLPDLTGGLDSRLVVGFLREAGLPFEVTVTGSEDDPDVRVAVALARKLGLALRRVPRERGLEAQASFDAVLRAAARVEGTYDAAEYASILAVHEPHSELFDLSVNGSGGEVFRNYWWDRSHLGRKVGDAAGELVRRFTHNVALPPFLAEPRDASVHFRAVLERTLAARAGDPFPALSDHAYLHLRMQCWQGAIASATNETWPTLSPLLLLRPLKALYRLPDEERLGLRLIRTLLLSFPGPFHLTALATGFPPAGGFFRSIPGLLGLPAQYGERLKGRLRRGRPDPGPAPALLKSGAADYLRPGGMALAPFLDAARLEAFLAQPTSLAVLGRLLALEWALREARAPGDR